MIPPSELLFFLCMFMHVDPSSKLTWGSYITNAWPFSSSNAELHPSFWIKFKEVIYLFSKIYTNIFLSTSFSMFIVFIWNLASPNLGVWISTHQIILWFHMALNVLFLTLCIRLIFPHIIIHGLTCCIYWGVVVKIATHVKDKLYCN